MHRDPTEMFRCPTWIGRDLFSPSPRHHAPANARVGVPTVHFEGHRCPGHRIQLRARTSPEDNDVAFHAVIHREDLDRPFKVKRDPT